MIPTYSFLKESLPSDTLRIIDEALPYINKYNNLDNPVVVGEKRYYLHDRETKSLLIFLNSATCDKEIEAFLSKFGFSKSFVKMRPLSPVSEDKKDDIISSNNDLFPYFKDKLDYETFYPSDLLIYLTEKYRDNGVTYILSDFNEGISSFLDELRNLSKSRKEKEEHELEVKTYEDLPMSVINYLETASKIRSLLLNSNYDYCSLKNVSSDDDITALSLFLALFNYDDLKDENDKSLSKGITRALSKLGLDQSNLRFENRNKFSSIKKNILAISRFYSRYFKEGHNEGKDTKDITVLDICNNLFDRNFTKSIVVEKILSMSGIDINKLKDFKQLVIDSMEAEKIEKENKDIEAFYSRTNNNTREFLSFSAKVYTLLLKKMAEGKHNKRILAYEDDADTLSLLISSYFFETDVSSFYKEHGISLEDIFNLIGISLTREEIEFEGLDKKVLINRFQRFATDGVNLLKESKKVTINEISHNLCNREFNRTTIMEDIFNILNDNSSLEPDFLNRMKEELEKKEKAREANLAQEIFKNSSAETISFYENVSVIHQSLERMLDNRYSKEDIRTLSLLVALLEREDTISEVFNDIGINYDKLMSTLNATILYDREPDIDIIEEEYIPYIKKVFGHNDIGIVSMYGIAKNLFKKENNNSIRITRLLGSFGLSYEDFDSFEDDYNSIAYKERLLGHDMDTDIAIKQAIGLFSYFYQKRENGKLNIPNVQSDDDIATLSLLIPISLGERVFEKYGIPSVLDCIGMSLSEYSEIGKRKLNYKMGYQFLSKFIGQSKEEETIDILKRLFNKDINESNLIESLLPDKKEYKALKYEIETGQDYESSLTIDDRITRLQGQQIDAIDVNNIASITSFGNSLRDHAKYIYDELPRIEQSDSNEKSIATIKDITAKVYPKALQKRNIFARLFSLEPKGSSQRITINQDAMDELRTAINENIAQLSEEVRGYDAIRRYLEAYKEKNTIYYQKLNHQILEVEHALIILNPDKDINEALKLKSTLAILRDKANRFATTISIAEQSLIRIYQSIVSHSITINSLDMAKTDLFPLIGAELAITQGKMTEKGAFELTENVIALFNSLLTGNIKETEEHMKILQKSNIPQELLDTISRDLSAHFKEISVGEQLGALSETPSLEAPKKKSKKAGMKQKRDD